MARRHVVISGTGRTGTTFLMVLLTDLGLDTGFSPDKATSRIDELARAGLENDIRREGCPYVVKSPNFCTHAPSIVSREDIVIDHVFIPMRDLRAAAESRRLVAEAGAAVARADGSEREVEQARRVPGGLWHTTSIEPGHQEEVLLQQLYKLLVALSGTTIPITLMYYPRLVNDCPYLFEKLKPVLGEITYETFDAAFRRTVRPDLVHSFNSDDR